MHVWKVKQWQKQIQKNTLQTSSKPNQILKGSILSHSLIF